MFPMGLAQDLEHVALAVVEPGGVERDRPDDGEHGYCCNGCDSAHIHHRDDAAPFGLPSFTSYSTSSTASPRTSVIPPVPVEV